MQCPSCGGKQKYRAGLTCLQCGYVHALSPKVRPYLSDRKVQTAIRHVGDDGARYFTVNQVLADMARRKRLRLGLRRATRELTFAEAQRAIITYHTLTGRLPGLLTEPRLETDLPPPWPRAGSWGLRGGTHPGRRRPSGGRPPGANLGPRERPTVILSSDGYPAEAWEKARALLIDRPDIPVGFLHGSAVVGPLAGMDVGRMLGARTTSCKIWAFLRMLLESSRCCDGLVAFPTSRLTACPTATSRPGSSERSRPRPPWRQRKRPTTAGTACCLPGWR